MDKQSIGRGATDVANATTALERVVREARTVLTAERPAVVIEIAAINTAVGALDIRIGEQNERVRKRVEALEEQRDCLYDALHGIVGALDEAYNLGEWPTIPNKHVSYHLWTSYQTGRDLADKVGAILVKEELGGLENDLAQRK